MQLPNRIRILGASGSGTTSLTSAIAGNHGHRRLDTDDFFWAPTNPSIPREATRRQTARTVAAGPAAFGSLGTVRVVVWVG